MRSAAIGNIIWDARSKESQPSLRSTDLRRRVRAAKICDAVLTAAGTGTWGPSAGLNTTCSPGRNDEMSSEATSGEPAHPTMLIPGRALLFDCDGVLVDSDASVVSAWSRWASRYALNPAEVVVLVHGRRSGDTVSALI